jgi:hypothetical protein
MNMVVRTRRPEYSNIKPTHKSEEISLDTFILKRLRANGDIKAIKKQ